MLNLLKITAFLILIISWVNYINLSTASSAIRSKEVGIRKAIGAQKKQIIRQFLIEATLINITAILIALIFVFIIVNPFSSILGLTYDIEMFKQTSFWSYTLLSLILGVFISGIYPAFILASFKSSDVLKTKSITSPANSLIRKILVTFQFTISMGLISCTIIMIHQNYFMKHQNIGVNIDNIIIVKKPQLIPKHEYLSVINEFKKELIKNSFIKNVSINHVNPTQSSWWLPIWKINEDHIKRDNIMSFGVDKDYISMYELKLLAGRNFYSKPNKDQNKIILSRSTCNAFNISNPEDALGMNFNIDAFKKHSFEVIGVIEDYAHFSLERNIVPLAMIKNQGLYNSHEYISIKTTQNQSLTSSLQVIENTYKQFFVNDLFNYYLLKSKYDLQYASTERNEKIYTLFSLLAIILACIGVIGLSSFITLLKIREIVIRKIYGASIKNVIWILSKEFIIILCISIIITIPFVYTFMDDWLNGFGHKIVIQSSHFAISFFIISSVVLMIIGFNVFKSNKITPSKALKN